MNGDQATGDTSPAPQSVEQWMQRIEPRLATVRSRIERAGGHEVALLAVSKGQPVEAAQAAAALGLRDLGENYAQELAVKAEQLHQDQTPVRWHFIGQLQSNKVRTVAQWVSLWQSVDRLRIAREIAKRTEQASVLVQVNLSRHEHKGGCGFDEVESLVEQIRELDVTVQGLMGVGEADDDDTTAAQFTRLRALCDRLGLAECSIGMSADLEIAIECGSTMVRVGSDIFGPRQMRADQGRAE